MEKFKLISDEQFDSLSDEDKNKYRKGIKENVTNKKLDAEKSLADMPNGNKKPKSSTKITKISSKKLDAEEYLSDSPSFKRVIKKGNKKLKPENNLSKIPKYGKGHNNTSNKKLDGEEYLSDSKHLKSFESFVNEYYFL